jgi:hypothetical protein
VKVRRSLLKDTVAVETYGGEGAYGPVYAASVNVKCNLDQTRRLVRTAAGDEAVSELTLQVHPDDVAYFTPESRLTVATRVSRVMSVKDQAFRGGTVYLEVACS